MTTSTLPATAQDNQEAALGREPQVRFNQGYWDGHSRAKQGLDNIWLRQPHFDPVYVTGYFYGFSDGLKGVEPESSLEAWTEAINWEDVLI